MDISDIMHGYDSTKGSSETMKIYMTTMLAYIQHLPNMRDAAQRRNSKDDEFEGNFFHDTENICQFFAAFGFEVTQRGAFETRKAALNGASIDDLLLSMADPERIKMMWDLNASKFWACCVHTGPFSLEQRDAGSAIHTALNVVAFKACCCSYCGEQDCDLVCSRCDVHYCSAECQKKGTHSTPPLLNFGFFDVAQVDWPVHRHLCIKFKTEMFNGVIQETVEQLNRTLASVAPETPGLSSIWEHLQIGGITDDNMMTRVKSYCESLKNHHVDRQDDLSFNMATIAAASIYDFPDSLEGLVSKSDLVHDGTINPELQWSKWFCLILLLQGRLHILRQEKDDSHSKHSTNFSFFPRGEEHDLMVHLLIMNLTEGHEVFINDDSASSCIKLFFDCFLSGHVPMAQFIFAEAARLANFVMVPYLTWLRISTDDSYPPSCRAEAREYIVRAEVERFCIDSMNSRLHDTDVPPARSFSRRRSELQFCMHLLAQTLEESPGDKRARIMLASIKSFVVPGTLDVDKATSMLCIGGVSKLNNDATFNLSRLALMLAWIGNHPKKISELQTFRVMAAQQITGLSDHAIFLLASWYLKVYREHVGQEDIREKLFSFMSHISGDPGLHPAVDSIEALCGMPESYRVARVADRPDQFEEFCKYL